MRGAGHLSCGISGDSEHAERDILGSEPVNTDWVQIDTAIGVATGQAFTGTARTAVGGGSINSAYRVGDGERAFFVKLNSTDRLEMFEAEADGLEQMAQTQTVRVPAPIAYGVAGTASYIVLEHLALGGGGDGANATLGRQLAALHRTAQPFFGWHRDNTIGSTPQPNPQAQDWIDFLREHRLRYQLRLASRNGHRGGLQRDGERLLVGLEGFFPGYRPQPSLLHGDLWGGNFAVATSGEPVIFDPACYFGDREADLAMTELFGGFGRAFYAAYQQAYALDAGYPVRKTLYNLYHVLNHLNLFGGSYLGQAEGMIRRLLSELR